MSTSYNQQGLPWYQGGDRGRFTHRRVAVRGSDIPMQTKLAQNGMCKFDEMCGVDLRGIYQ